MEYQYIANTFSVLNTTNYNHNVCSGAFNTDKGNPYRMCGVRRDNRKWSNVLYNDHLEQSGIYTFGLWDVNLFVSPDNEDRVKYGNDFPGCHYPFAYKTNSYKWEGLVNPEWVYKTSAENTKVQDYREGVFSIQSRTVNSVNYNFFRLPSGLQLMPSNSNTAQAYDSVSFFKPDWAESIPYFATEEEAILYVNDIIDDSTAVQKAWDPNDDTVDEKNNDKNPTHYDETKFNTPQVTPMQVSGANNYYCVNVANVQAFVQWLWDDLIKEGTLSDWLLDSITKISGNLYSCITGLKLFPCNIKKHLATVANTPLVLGRFSGGFDVIDASSYNCKIGSVTYKIPSTYGNFLDYQPYTTGLLYLPFVGFSQLDMTVFQPGETMKIDCFVDITTGVIDYAVSIQNKDNTFSLVEHHTGTCGITIPLSYDNASQWLSNFVGGAVKDTVATITGKGATSIGEMASDITGGLLDSFDTPTNYSVGAPSPSNGLYFPMKPHIVIKSPMYKRPSTYSKNVGFPCMASYNPNTLKGYTVFQNPQLTFGHTKNSEGEKVLPTKEEMDLLYQLMTEGVYL